jgi:rRNA-processing protein FCF1
MKFKRVKTSKTGRNTNTRYLVWTQKKRKWADRSKEKYISKKKSIVIEGAHASGKTREIEKIKRRAAEVWGGAATIIYLRATDSLADWFNKNLRKEDEAKLIQANPEEAEEIAANIKKQHIKIAQLIHKIDGGVLMVDDIDKLAGKKKEIIKDLVRAAGVVVCTASDYREIDNTIERQLKNKGVEVLKMSSDASYDATYVLFAMFIIALFMAGQPELAMLIMAGRYAMKGIQK